jgi:hypothetical protein
MEGLYWDPETFENRIYAKFASQRVIQNPFAPKTYSICYYILLVLSLIGIISSCIIFNLSTLKQKKSKEPRIR